MDHIALLGESHDHDGLTIFIPEASFPSARAVSWAVQGGGFTAPRIIVNHSIPKGVWIENAETYIAEFLRRRELPRESIVMLTAVAARFLGRADAGDRDGVSVRAYATVGLGNALAAGDPAPAIPAIGTINAIIVIAATCTDEALLEGLAIATEAKARFLAEHDVRSTVSGAIATGTGTDCLAILSLGVGPRVRYAGKHTKTGESVAQAVMQAMARSIELRRAGTP